MFGSIGILLIGNVGGAFLTVLRTIVISRLISLEDFGIGTVLVLVLAMVEMSSALGFQQQIVQASDGNGQSFQQKLQGVSILRGLLAGSAIYLLAHPISSFFDMPQTVGAIQFIAIIPVILGFIHLDIHRLARQMKHFPSAIVALLPPLGSLISVVPLSHLYSDYRLMLFAVLVQAGLTVMVSHWAAIRDYQFRIEPKAILRSLHFGWPVMVSGTLLFLVFNAERAIIGHNFGLEALALFSVALSLTLLPALVVSRTTMSFFLPQLSALRSDASYAALATATLQIHVLLGSAFVVIISFTGEPFLLTMLGTKYQSAAPFLIWFAILQAFRIFEGGCAIVALSAAQTTNEIMANVVRVALLPAAWLIAQKGGDVVSIIWIGTIGEAAGFAVGLTLASRRQQLSVRPLIAPLALAIMTLALVASSHVYHLGWWTNVMTLAFLIATGCYMRELRIYLRKPVVAVPSGEKN